MNVSVRLYIVGTIVALTGVRHTGPRHPIQACRDPATSSMPRTLAADTPSTTVLGNTFVAPSGWSVSNRGNETLLEVPEKGSFISIIDIPGGDADAAVVAAWVAYKPDAKWPLKVVTPVAPRDNWTDRKSYQLPDPPEEHRDVFADVRRANNVWTVVIHDMSADVGRKRRAQVNLIFGQASAKGLPARELCR